MHNLAPIALFVYNRPKHTQKTIEALLLNIGIENSDIYVFSDAPKSELDIENVEKVREIIKKIKGAKSLNIYERTENKGLAKSIIEGVSEIVNRHGKVIVLEDDLVTSTGFLQYMNDALNLYKNDTSVMHISGYVLPVKKKLPETFFFNQTTCWGWATWDRAWKHFIVDAVYLKKELTKKNLLKPFNIDNSYDYMKQLQENIDGIINTWAVKWQACVVLTNGLCLHPKKSLVQNIGLDWSGTHTGPMPEYFHIKLADSINVNRIELVEHSFTLKVMSDYYKKHYSRVSIFIKIKKIFFS